MTDERSAEQITGFRGFQVPATALDVETAVVCLGGSWQAYCDVAEAFLEHMATVLPQLAPAVATSASLEDLVHDAGSSLGAVGAMQALGMARAMEENLRRGNAPGANSLHGLRSAIEAAVAAVRAVTLEGGAGAGPLTRL